MQFSGTAIEADFVDKRYKNCRKTTVTWVFKVHRILGKSFYFLDPLLLDLKEAVSLVVGWAEMISHSLLGTRGPKPGDSFRSVILQTAKMMLKNKQETFPRRGIKTKGSSNRPSTATAIRDPCNPCLAQRFSSTHLILLTRSAAKLSDDIGAGWNQAWYFGVCLHVEAQQLSCSS